MSVVFKFGYGLMDGFASAGVEGASCRRYGLASLARIQGLLYVCVNLAFLAVIWW